MCRYPKRIIAILYLMITMLSVQWVYAAEQEYKAEIGLQGGLGYYVGDATSHIFMNVREAYGIQFRYKFDPRWALQVKGQGQRIAFPLATTTAQVGSNQLINLDIVGEFNFFRFGAKQYDDRVKPLTPYIFLGIGVATYSDFQGWAAYMPFGLGLKWKFAERWGLHLAWQQNLYFADSIEGIANYNNTYNMNGSNILKNDLTSSFTIGIVFEIGQKDKICRLCDD